MRDSFYIRPERAGDESAIRAVNLGAFDSPDEAALVDDLRQRSDPFISLVACNTDQVVGHISFSPVTIRDQGQTHSAIALAPLAVLPAFQRQGIGGQLVRDGLDACRAAGYEIVIVLGHPNYYPRFGFERASLYDIRWEHEAPDEAFMVTALKPGALEGIKGIVSYHPAFDRFS